MKIDYHIHSDTSSDNKIKPKEIYEEAEKKGIKDVCVTCHHEPSEVMKNEFKQSLTKEKLDAIRKDVSELNKKGTVKMHLGVEMSYTEAEEEYIRQYLKENKFDFVLGSIHYVLGIKIAEVKNRDKVKDPDALMKEYFRLLKKAISSRLFDVIAHIDICKLMVPEPNHAVWTAEWKDVARLLHDNHVGFELNTSHVKYKPGDIYPSQNILNILTGEKEQVITLGSDAHKPEDIGRMLNEAEIMLKQLGVKNIYKFEHRTPIKVTIN